MDHYSSVVVPVGSDGFDKLDESAAGLWDSVLRPRCVVEVADQNVVPVLHRGVYTKEKEHVKFPASLLCYYANSSVYIVMTKLKRQL